MTPILKFPIWKKILFSAGFFLVALLAWQSLKQAPLQDDWQVQLATPSMAEFNGNLVTVKNVRNFRYSPTEHDMHPAYYDKT